MKRLFFGLCAIVLAAASAAFTTPETNVTDAYFAFNTAYSPTIANVEDESKWVLVSDMNNCPTGDDRACKIRVTASHYSGSTLLSNTNIQADESASNIAYVLDADAVQIVNKANP